MTVTHGRARAAAALVASALAVALTLGVAHGAEPPSPASFDDFARRVSESRRIAAESSANIESTAVASALAYEVESRFPPSERLTEASVTVRVDNTVVRALAARVSSPGGRTTRRERLEELDAYLASLQSAVGVGGRAVPEDPEALEALIAQSRLQGGSETQAWLRRLVERAGEWLAGLFEGVRGAPGGTAVLVALEAVVAGGLLLLLGYAVYAAVRNARNSTVRRPRAPRGAAVTAAESVTAAEGLPPDALAHAEALARRGERRAAVRALFGGAARSLVLRGIAPDTGTRTNSELISDVSARRPGLVPPLRELSSRFEVAWYGHVEPEPAGYDAAREAYLRVTAVGPDEGSHS